MVGIEVQVSHQGSCHAISCDDDDSIEILRAQIASILHIPAEQQVLKISSSALPTKVLLPFKDTDTPIKTWVTNNATIVVAATNAGNGNGAASKSSSVTTAPNSLNPDTIRQFVNAFAAALQQRQQTQAATSTPPASSDFVSATTSVAFEMQIQGSCSRVFLGNDAVMQPAAFSQQSTSAVCMACASTCHIPTSMLARASQTPFVCACTQSGHECLFSPRLLGLEMLRGQFKESAKKILEKAALAQQQLSMGEGMRQMSGRLESALRSVQEYENKSWQDQASRVIPLDKLKERAQMALDKKETELSMPDEIARQLLRWFKHEFFHWVNSPQCSACNGPTSGMGGTPPNADEQPWKVGIVELYRCNNSVCGTITRFPRFNHPCKLLETRKGRCGEWANCFSLCARSLGYHIRHVVDWTDHVWTEIWSDALQRWIHHDPCENVRDGPMMYEGGWGKKLTYVIAFGHDHICDVTQRYSKKWQEVRPRRTQCPEEWLKGQISAQNSRLRGRRDARLATVQDASDQIDFDKNLQAEEEAIRSAKEKEKQSSQLTEEEKRGRQTGSVAWRAARGELGTITAEDVAAEPKRLAQNQMRNGKSTADVGGAASPAAASSAASGSPAAAAVVVSAAGGVSGRSGQAVVKLLFGVYVQQLSRGCGDSCCTNVDFCVSANSKKSAASKDEIGKEALRLIKEFQAQKVCTKLQENLKQ